MVAIERKPQGKPPISGGEGVPFKTNKRQAQVSLSPNVCLSKPRARVGWYLKYLKGNQTTFARNLLLTYFEKPRMVAGQVECPLGVFDLYGRTRPPVRRVPPRFNQASVHGETNCACAWF